MNDTAWPDELENCEGCEVRRDDWDAEPYLMVCDDHKELADEYRIEEDDE